MELEKIFLIAAILAQFFMFVTHGLPNKHSRNIYDKIIFLSVFFLSDENLCFLLVSLFSDKQSSELTIKFIKRVENLTKAGKTQQCGGGCALLYKKKET